MLKTSLHPAKKSRIKNLSIAVRQDRELQELVRRGQELADQANAVLRRALDQNEGLQRMLEQTRRELLELREEVGELRAILATRLAGERAAPVKAAVAVPQTAGKEAAGDDHAARLARLEDQVEINAAQIHF